MTVRNDSGVLQGVKERGGVVNPVGGAVAPINVVRRFNGTTDFIRTLIGACPTAGPLSAAVIFRPQEAAPASQTVFAEHTVGGEGKGFQLALGAGHDIGIWNGVVFANCLLKLEGVAGQWLFLGASKTAGVSKWRYHLKNLTAASAMQHADALLVSGDASPCPGGTLRYAEWQASERGKFDYEACGFWTSALSDGEMEALAAVSNISKWLPGPVCLHEMKQLLVAEPLIDYAGGGASQSAISGTAVLNEAPPVAY